MMSYYKICRLIVKKSEEIFAQRLGPSGSGTPIEIIESGKEATIKVFYDHELNAQRMIIQVGTKTKVIAASELDLK